jgi:hypothetical protein
LLDPATARMPLLGWRPRTIYRYRDGEQRNMSRQSLEDLLQTVRTPVELLRNSQIGPYVYPVVPREFTSWIDE